MEAGDSYETLVNLCQIARNYNTALSGTCLETFARQISQIFRVQFGVHFSFCCWKNAHWWCSLQHFRSVSFLLLFLSDASSVRGRTFPAVRYGGRLSGLWRDQQSPLYAESYTITLSWALQKEWWRWSQQKCGQGRVGQNRTRSGRGVVAAGKQSCASTCLLCTISWAL